MELGSIHPTVHQYQISQATDMFFGNCMKFFPWTITHILTDNEFEFTNRLTMSKKGVLCTKPSLLDIKCSQNNMEHDIRAIVNHNLDKSPCKRPIR